MTSFSISKRMLSKEIQSAIVLALKEDLGRGDFTTQFCVPKDQVSKGQFIIKSKGVIAGLEVAQAVFQYVDDRCQMAFYVEDGAEVLAGKVVASILGPSQALLSAERVALNFMQRMSGIATQTQKYVKAAPQCTILDTRKTAPGLRALDKWAVRLGGGKNHRFGLDDMILVKENHIEASGSISKALHQVFENNQDQLPVVIEVKTLDEVSVALQFPIYRILLDNFNLSDIQKSVQLVSKKIPLEVSGNVTLKTVGDIAKTGVDFISVGALTHSVKALDISFMLEGKKDDF
ncbi:MAG: nicotinate-nucleotide diphosphorylase (carboxylating) [Deltaproteobacteria bacterium RIFCSPHIGHO2_02_FULL_40_11]|nr:MAG: nicotinate-nucleotide diphosphorylase (carboxylating) [Deltaproteobacteria bacterium RIFCSPHIGHO2_02_FULL_40_11]